MSEVSARTCIPIVEAVRDRGVPGEELVRNLSVSVETLTNPSKRIRWDDFTFVLENAARILGGPEQLESISCRYYARTGNALGALAASVVDVRPLYHLGARWYGPSLYTSTRASCDDLPDGRVRQVIEILPGFRDSELFFRGMRGGLRSTPVLLGQPLAEVEMEIEPRRGIFHIRPPPALPLLKRLRRLFSRHNVLEAELAVYNEELRYCYDLARTAHDRLDDQTRRLEAERGERVRAEEMLQQAQRVEAVGRLAGGIAHDFNNVLTAITGYAELALDRAQPGDPLAEDLGEIRLVSERGAGLVKQILAFSKRQSQTLRRLELNSVILGMETMLNRLLPEHLELVILPAHEPMLVLANPGQIEQIVVNLVVNARDAMPGGGRIDVEVRHSSAREMAERGWKTDRVARLEVRDGGRGMDAATLERAFEPFFTTRGGGQGTGLGLATVRDIATRCGGAARLESEPGKGTTAIVELPALSGPVEIESAAPEVPSEPRGDETVLLVEDEKSVRTVMRRTFETRSYKVLAAGDAEEALALARTHAEEIELLVSDLMLPGANGRELAHRIDTLCPALRGVVFVSGHALEAFAASDAALPANYLLLHKPFDAHALLGAARKVLDAPGG